MQEKQTTTLQIELPTSLAAQAQKLVEADWFRNLENCCKTRCAAF